MRLRPRSREPISRAWIVRRLWLAPLVVVGAFALTTGVACVTASPAACALCHPTQVAEWRTSAHTKAGCPSCHEGPRAWYRVAGVLVPRTAMVGRYVGEMFFGVAASEGTESAEAALRLADTRCRSCHHDSRVVTARDGTLIDHAAHVKRNHSCLSCHRDVAHPSSESKQCSRLMTRCFCCHGRGRKAKAPGTCSLCHPKNFDLVPASHDGSAWQKAHPKALERGQGECSICHDKTYCRDCHGVEIPHPADWTSGRSGHRTFQESQWPTCEKCHEKGPDGCKACHHQRYAPTTEGWLGQHPAEVREGGSATCFDCHLPTNCARCHTDRKSRGAGR